MLEAVNNVLHIIQFIVLINITLLLTPVKVKKDYLTFLSQLNVVKVIFSPLILISKPLLYAISHMRSPY